MTGRKQFDVDTAVDAAMIEFWRDGYAATSLDDLCAATGLNRSSLYASFGDKDALYLRCLDRYAARYGARYDAALGNSPADAAAAVRNFFDVTLARIADPDVPDGCLIALTAMAIPTLCPAIVTRTGEALEFQRRRIRSALRKAGFRRADVDALAVHVAAVNQSLAVMSRAGASTRDLRSVVRVTVDAVAARTPSGRG